MAKTLIGNIKGKNGRGITSIKKTGTTGSVDTYTITYTDDTTSTFTINNSDSISLQRQIVPSAAVESSATASQAYAAGDYVVVSGILRKVKSAIAKGNAISDSNSIATTVTGELVTVGDSVSQINSDISKSTGWTYLEGSSAGLTPTTGYVRYRVNRFSVELDIDYPLSDASDKKLSKLIPDNLRPYETYWFAICATKRWNKSDHMAYCEVKKDGTIWLGRGGAEEEGRVVGSVSWVIP